MNELEIVGLCVIILTTVITITLFLTKAIVEDKIETKYYNAFNEKSEPIELQEEDFPGLLSCPSCRNTKINVNKIINIPHMYMGNDGHIKHNYITGIISYKIICPECGMQTTDFARLSKAIINWNGRSESAEIVKKENLC